MKIKMLVVLTAVVTACGPSQEQADAAIEAAQEAITAQHADALRFAPDAFAEVMEGYGIAKARYDSSDWGGAVEAAEAAAAKARQLAGAIAEGKERAVEEWPAVRAGVADMLTALGGRLDDAARTRRYPEGMGAAEVRDARVLVDSLAAGLERAGREFDGGDVAGAMHAAERIRMQAGTLMADLGLQPNPHGS